MQQEQLLLTPHGRVRRFDVGDWVAVVEGGSAPREGRVFEWEADAHPPALSHCSGKSARYLITGGGPGDWVYDWQLTRPEHPNYNFIAC